MTSLTGTPSWDDVLQIETDMDVVGGAGGIANLQAQSLANRTELLKNSPIVTVSGTSYTILVSDQLKYIRTTGGSATSIVVPTNTSAPISVGVSIAIRQGGLGQVTISPQSGVTVNTPETLKSRKQHSTVMLTKVSANIWDLTGDLEAAP